VGLDGLEPSLKVGTYAGVRALPELALRATYRPLAPGADRALSRCVLVAPGAVAGAPGSSCSHALRGSFPTGFLLPLRVPVSSWWPVLWSWCPLLLPLLYTYNAL